MREAAKKTALQNKQSGFVAESLDNIVVYKINQCVNFINKKFTNNQNNEDICHQNVNKLFGLTRFCFGMTNIICFCFSILMIIKIKQLYPGISSGMYFMQFWWAMMAFWDIMWTVMPMFYCIGKLKNSMGFIKESLDIQSKTNEITEFRSLEVKNLTFLNHGQAIFENFNLKCENSFVVIEGASGVGKTTLFNLIFGFRTPDKNTIFINNQDILSINNLHKNISFLPQKDLIYNDSFLKNIILEEDYDDQKLHKILLMLKIDQHLSLDDLDHKQCGTNGNEISGGQAKRIAIARMLLFDNSHKLMLLDEPFNNLSDDIIDNFLGYLKSIKGSRSIVCIDHTGHFRKLADHLVKIGNNDEITLIS
jgi:ABC-type transport system involved in cytochrome bd biosynthesis fused ATPase/permease subunit